MACTKKISFVIEKRECFLLSKKKTGKYHKFLSDEENHLNSLLVRLFPRLHAVFGR